MIPSAITSNIFVSNTNFSLKFEDFQDISRKCIEKGSSTILFKKGFPDQLEKVG